MCTIHRSDAIYSAKYDGSGLIEVLRGHEYLSHPFAVTMYGGEVYWTDWRTNTLAKANKWTGSNVTVVQRTNTQPFDLQVYHPSRQPQGKKHTQEHTHTFKLQFFNLSSEKHDNIATEATYSVTNSVFILRATTLVNVEIYMLMYEIFSY